jgi:hypothetical protein
MDRCMQLHEAVESMCIGKACVAVLASHVSGPFFRRLPAPGPNQCLNLPQPPALRACAWCRNSESGLPRTAVVGVLGGGQLGRMMALAAVRSPHRSSLHQSAAALCSCSLLCVRACVRTRTDVRVRARMCVGQGQGKVSRTPRNAVRQPSHGLMQSSSTSSSAGARADNP